MMRYLTILASLVCVQAFSMQPTSVHRLAPGLPRPLFPLHMIDPSTSLEVAASSGLSFQNKDVWVFIAGLIPFGWATVEFWRRIAVGEPFGTGKDSVYIGKDNVPSESRGRQTLDRGAFVVAYILFGLAAGAIGLTLYSVVTSAPLPESLSP